MTPESIIELSIFGVVSIAVFIYLHRLNRVIEMSAKTRQNYLLNMAAITGIWELSVAVIVARHASWPEAIGPGGIGAAMIAARWVVPAIRRHLS